MSEPACVACGCTEDRACEGGCAWRAGFLAIGVALCTRCKIRFHLPLPANLGNSRQHWALKSNAHQAWCQRAIVLEPWLRGGRPPQRPLQEAVISPLMVLGQPMDPDNATARLKWAIDLLVDRGWLVDDGPAHLTLLKVHQIIDRAKQPKLTLALWDRVATPRQRKCWWCGKPATRSTFGRPLCPDDACWHAAKAAPDLHDGVTVP